MKFNILENAGYKQFSPMYHGRASLVKNWKDVRIGKGHDQDGPGIYFTESIEDASMYGNYLYTVILSLKKYVDNDAKIKNFNIKEANILIQSSKEYLDEDGKWTDWGEDRQSAIKTALDAYEDCYSVKDLFESVWFDWYKGYEWDYLNNMVKLGYDGVILDPGSSGGVQHIVMFNPSNIETIKIDEIKDKNI